MVTAASAAGQAVRRELRPGEQVAGGAAMTAQPPRWVTAAVLALAAALAAVSLAGLAGQHPGPLASGPANGLAAVLLLLGLQLLPRRVFVAVTGQRLICLRLSRLRRAPRQLAFAVPLAEARVVKYRPGRLVSFLMCEIPGHGRIRLEAGPGAREDFAAVAEALARSGAFAKLDPPWPSAEIS
jgi:hypothetical protein